MRYVLLKSWCNGELESQSKTSALQRVFRGIPGGFKGVLRDFKGWYKSFRGFQTGFRKVPRRFSGFQDALALSPGVPNGLYGGLCS